MSLKLEIETWVSALAAYDNNEFESALRAFGPIADTSKILFNVGIIHATLGEHQHAVQCYQQAVQLDPYLAVAYFQQGVSNFLLGDFEEALANFNDTLLYLRGNKHIDYEQLGLKFKLYSCEALFNRGLCYIYLQQKDSGLQDLLYATREKVVPDHDVIDEAIKEQAEGYTVFSIPVGVLYRPNEAKVKNLKQKDYLGKARLVAQQDQLRRDPKRALAAIGVDDRPSDKLSYAALNLVKPGLSSRSRQQSEPPLSRNVFPPTPPPEPERTETTPNHRRSVESFASLAPSVQGKAKPLRLDLGIAAFEHKTEPEKPRPAPRRAESERPSMRRHHSGSSFRGQESRRREERQPLPQEPEMQVIEDPVQAYSQQTLSPAQASLHHRSRSSAHTFRQHTMSIAEEAEEDDIVSPSEEPLAFEILPPKSLYERRRSQSRRAPEIRKIRVKVHADDMRYVMMPSTMRLGELVSAVKVKYGVEGGLRLKIKDEEGDMVTVSDQDDLDMAIDSCKAVAVKERSDMGKMEVWMQAL